MGFRDQREHLQHKNEMLERELQEERRKRSEESKEHGKKRQAAFWALVRAGLGVVIGTCLIVGTLIAGDFGVKYIVSISERYELEAVMAHQQRLADMRSQIPEGVDERTWLWCVDHCARFGEHDGRKYAEGIVTDTFEDYRYSPPATLVTISGPWMNSLEATHQSFQVTSEEVDPPSHFFTVGDVVRVTHITGQHSTSYTFRLIHPE